MKKILFSSILLFGALAANAQTTSRLSAGIGLGASSSSTSTDVRFTPGIMGSIDLGYTRYYSIGNDIQIGFRTGLGITGAQNGVKTEYVDSYVFTDSNHNLTDYLITSPSVNYQKSQWSVEIPVMFAFENNGFMANLGMKFQIPFVTRFSQYIESPMILTYSQTTQEYKVNDPTTGFVSSEQQTMSGKGYNAACYFALAAEFGYVWKLKGNHSLGFLAFIDYSPWSAKPSNGAGNALIEVTHPKGYICADPAVVTVSQLPACKDFNLIQFNAGLKVLYTFDIKH